MSWSELLDGLFEVVDKYVESQGGSEAYQKRVLRDIEERNMRDPEYIDRQVEYKKRDIKAIEKLIELKNLEVKELLASKRLDAVSSFYEQLDQSSYEDALNYLDKLAIRSGEELTLADRYISPEVRKAVWERDGGRCVKCGSQSEIHYDHIVPHSKGGSTTIENLQLLCKTCNLKKGPKIDG